MVIKQQLNRIHRDRKHLYIKALEHEIIELRSQRVIEQERSINQITFLRSLLQHHCIDVPSNSQYSNASRPTVVVEHDFENQSTYLQINTRKYAETQPPSMPAVGSSTGSDAIQHSYTPSDCVFSPQPGLDFERSSRLSRNLIPCESSPIEDAQIGINFVLA